jgi:hypothetical protein
VKFVKTNPDALVLGGLSSGCRWRGPIGRSRGCVHKTSLEVSALLPVSAVLMRASAWVAGDYTRALAPACVRVGRPAGSALRRAAFTACTHQGQGGPVSPRRQRSRSCAGLGGK